MASTDLKEIKTQGDKENSDFFWEYLGKIYDRRREAGIDDMVGLMRGVAIGVEHGDGLKYVAELTVMGPYRLIDARLTDTHKVYLLRSQPEFPRLFVIEPLAHDYEDEITRWNRLYPLASKKANSRYIGEIYATQSVGDVRDALEAQNIRFVYPEDASNPFLGLEKLSWTFLSDYTYNRVGYMDADVDLDSLEDLGIGEGFDLAADEREMLEKAAALQAEHGIDGLVLGIDHMATRILSGDREHAILEYLTMVPYYFWGAYNIGEMNSSTNVTRHPDLSDEKQSPARVFTANNTPSYVNSFENLPMPTEDFVRNFGRRMHHMAYAVQDGHVVDEKNVDYVVRQLSEMGTKFLAHVVGECKDDPNLKQIFSKSSDYSMLITEYIERCHDYEGFFTRDNVAALTQAAGADERYEHGHVFD